MAEYSEIRQTLTVKLGIRAPSGLDAAAFAAAVLGNLLGESHSLCDDGAKVSEGLTTVEEVLRVLGPQ